MRSARPLYIGLIALLLLLSSTVHAAMTGGLAAPLGAGQATVSVSLAYIERDVQEGDVRDEARSRRILFKGEMGVGYGLDFYAFLGMTDLSFRDMDFDGNLGETFGLGVRWGDISLGDESTTLVLDGQAEYFASDDGSFTAKQQAYHVAAYVVKQFGAAGRVGYFYPFAGVRFSYARLENEHRDDFENDDIFGLLAGADYFVNPNVFFSGELHLFDENSFYLTAGYRF